MTLKEMINQNFSDPKQITLERYKSAKFAFIISTFLFFVNFYLVWANFYKDLFSASLGITYIIMLLSLVFYIYFFMKNMFFEKTKSTVFLLILVLLFLIFVILLLPVVFKWGIIWVFNVIM